MSDVVSKAFRASRLDRVRWYIAAWIIPGWMLRQLLRAVEAFPTHRKLERPTDAAK